MTDASESGTAALQVAHRWCGQKGSGWSIGDQLGKGGTAPVFEVTSPEGPRALKIYDVAFSAGEKGEIEQRRIDEQLSLKGHDCPFLVQVYEGGIFESRLFLLMSRAPGAELGMRLREVPREKIRQIVDQVARAALFLKSKNLCHRDIKAENVFISNDFSQATLLDISVIRNIFDPVGLGTDHDGQLPVIATARYSPPEYLFRLLEPGPELWHALNIYQLGALLHDLIVRSPLFQEEFTKCATNRYRFAWTVASVIPEIQADDVDEDMIFTARRALDKDWKRRSGLRLEDFLADANVRQGHALRALGLETESELPPPDVDIAAKLQRVREVSGALEEAVLQYLRKNGVTAVHEVRPGGNDTSRVLIFCWDAPTAESEPNSRRIEFRLVLELLVRPGGFGFGIWANLSASIDRLRREVKMELPELQDKSGFESPLASQAVSALAQLAVEITLPRSGASGA